MDKSVKISKSVDQEKQLTIFVVDGKPSFENIEHVIKPLYEEHPTRNLLWDLRNTRLENWTSNDFEDIADFVKQHAEVRAGGKTAFVVSSELEYGLFRMLDTFGEIKNVPISRKVFHSMDEAVHWLE